MFLPRTSLLIISLGLAACGAEGSGDPSHTSASSASPTTPEAAAPAAEEQAAGPDRPAAPLPTSIEIAEPLPRIRFLETVEDLSEEVADSFLDFSASIQKRDFAGAAEFLGTDFAATGLAELELGSSSAGHLGTSDDVYSIDSARIVGAADFMAGIESWTGRWARIENVLWKTKGAEFRAGEGPRWGRVHLKVSMLGEDGEGRREEFSAWAWARVERSGREWFFTRFALESAHLRRAAGPLFTDVSAEAGVAQRGIRYGQAGNDTDHWQGVAAGDVDGDGIWDLFMPGRGRNFLYRRSAGGAFRERAAAAGLSGEGVPSGGTGAVFFDFDNDGDQDLAVAQVGWHDGRGRPAGETLRLFANDGQGAFSDVTAASGLDLVRVGFTLTVFDYDGDGWLDLFLCGYGRVGAEHNNSWRDATNGAPNTLLRNLEGQRFEDVTAAAGLADARWSYASAAADYDYDGDLDLYVANDYGTNALYQNDGKGTFVDVAEKLGLTDRGNGMGVAWGDLDRNGSLDLYVSNMSSTAGNRILRRLSDSMDESLMGDLLKLAAGNTIFTRNKEGGFDALPRKMGGVGASWAWCPALVDLDLDGYLDVYCANGYVTGDLAHDT
ncbi:MAG TPA: VCBS repeat-containing protein [Planctomycetota bacterium]|jgi:hypothetical protein|nr:VCBS repeat-containing protein [Planctomycetota bacterium]